MTTSRSTPRLRLTAVLLLAVVLLVMVSARPRFTGTVGEIMQLAGLACIVLAALGRVWTSVFIAGYKDSTLVRLGPYAAVRHPLYALSLLAMLGLGLTTRSLAITGAIVVAFGVVYRRAAAAEDRLLARLHPDSHGDFLREVPAFLPRAAAWTVPESLEVRPRVLWKAFLDAGSLLGLYVIVRLADLAQSTGLTPTWFVLP